MLPSQSIYRSATYFDKSRLCSLPDSLEFSQLDTDFLPSFPSSLQSTFLIAIPFTSSIINGKKIHVSIIPPPSVNYLLPKKTREKKHKSFDLRLANPNRLLKMKGLD